MTSRHYVLFYVFFHSLIAYSQNYSAGFKSIRLVDSTRIYKPNTKIDDPLHYRPVDLDIWYPSNDAISDPMLFRDLFTLLEQRATNYQDGGDFIGITEELAQFYVAELGVGTDGKELLNIRTNTYLNLAPDKRKHPLIIYMAGLNGMGFENYKILENLAQNGYVVVAIWSVGRYPGNMTNKMADMMQQVQDAEFAVDYLSHNSAVVNSEFNNLGVIGCSWGGMSAAVFAKRNPTTKVFVSLDGTETHYFGEDETDDSFIKEIHDQKLLSPASSDIRYLYLESGDKLEDFTVSEAFNYFDEVPNEKHYLRFTNSQHSDFTCIPSILKTTPNAVEIHNDIQVLTLSYLNKALKNQNDFEAYWDAISKQNHTTTEAFNLKKENGITTVFSGTVVNKQTEERLPYVSIGIVDKGVGTVSNVKGEFVLKLKNVSENDTIKISSIGFTPFYVIVKEMVDGKVPSLIRLEKRESKLNEVFITSKKLKKKILGNKTESRFLSDLFYYGELGKELGIKINIHKKPTYIDQFNFHVAYNRFSAKTLFRLNMYTLKTGKPDQNIIKDTIIIPVDPKQTGRISIDLKKFNIVVTEDILVALEWVDVEGKLNETEALQVSLGLMTGGTYERESTQAPMKKILKGMGLGYTLNVRQ